MSESACKRKESSVGTDQSIVYLIRRNGRYLSTLFVDDVDAMFGETSTDVGKIYAYNVRAIAVDVANDLGGEMVPAKRIGLRYELA